MSRDDGFSRADVDVGLLDDPKVRRLIRATTDEAVIARCLVGYVSVVLASWDRGERVTLEDAAPMWLTALGEVGDRLADVKLLDTDGMVPEAAWRAWFGAATERRRLGRERQHRADVNRGRVKGTKAVPPSDSPTDSSGPSVPPIQPSVRQSGPPPDQRGSNVGGTRSGIVPTAGACRDCGGYLTDKEPCRVGPGWIEHAEHPKAGVA